MSTEVFSAVSGDPDNLTLPVIVLCHGAMDRSAGMLRLSRQLDDQALVIRYDRRGYARSSTVGPPHTVEANIDDLEAVIERHAPGRRISLAFGHSLGGNIVLGLADRRPGLVDRAAVYETPMSWLDWWPSTGAGGAAALAAQPTGDPRGPANDGDAAEAFMRRLIGDERWEGLRESTRDGRRSEGAAMMAELTDLRRAAPWRAERVTCPVLTMSGEHGRPHHQRGMRLVAEMIEHAEHVELSGAGHGAPNTNPAELAAVLTGWLTG
jgi:pimeloyl-ACP methyl ester carboxylesterase